MQSEYLHQIRTVVPKHAKHYAADKIKKTEQTGYLLKSIQSAKTHKIYSSFFEETVE